MYINDSFIRRINDENYQIELAKYLENVCLQGYEKFKEACNKNPFLNNRVKKIYDNKNLLSEEQYKKQCENLLDFVFDKDKNFLFDKIEKFNKKWDKEHYKVYYEKFGGNYVD